MREALLETPFIELGTATPRTDGAARILELPILREAAPEAAARAAQRATWRSYPAGALILDIDDRSSDVFFVLEGAVRVQMRTPGGKELILSEITAGDLFGEIAAIDGAPRTANVTAILPSRVCILPAEAFLDAACSTPRACLILLRHTTQILRRQAQRVLEREALPVRLRLCAELLRLSRRRQGLRAGGGAEERIVSPPPPQHELAARIGARREVVSRELADMARQGLIQKVRGGIVIPRPEALGSAIESEPGAAH
jgi:CRP-like cAMP-binding protein